MDKVKMLKCLSLIAIMTLVIPFVYAEEAKEEVSFEISPSVLGVVVSGDKEKYEEDHWGSRNVTGGISKFKFSKKYENGDYLEMQGSAIVDNNDYSFDLDFEREGVGKLIFEFEEFRKYYDGTGGYSTLPGLAGTPLANSYELDTDIHMDIGNVKIEGILEKEDSPKYTFKYEREYKDGAKSLTSWGSVEAGSLDPKIYPTFIEIDEIVDIFKVGVEHRIKDVDVSAEHTWEKTEIETQKINNQTFSSSGLSSIRNKYEDLNYDLNTTIVRFARDWSEKVFTSLGVMFSHYVGGTIETITDTSTSIYNENHPANPATIERDALTFVPNVSFSPYKGLFIDAGLRAEFIAKKGSSTYDRDKNPIDGARDEFVSIKSATDEKNWAETLKLRYTRMRDVVLYAEAEFEQNFIGQFEKQDSWGDTSASSKFERDTDAKFYNNDFTIGFKWYPMTKANVTVQYKNKNHTRDYDHTLIAGNAVGGYSAYIDSIKTQSHIPSLRLNYKPIRWLSCNLGYTYEKTTYGVRTQASDTTEAGNYRAHIYSTSVTVVPYDYFYLSLFYQKKNAATVTRANGDGGSSTIEPTDNANVDVLGVTWSYAPTQKTTLTGGYSMYYTDNFNDYLTTGLALGLNNFSQDISIGLEHRLNDNRSLEFKYSFAQYDEDSNAGIDDYEAHIIHAGMKIRF